MVIHNAQWLTDEIKLAYEILNDFEGIDINRDIIKKHADLKQEIENLIKMKRGFDGDRVVTTAAW